MSGTVPDTLVCSDHSDFYEKSGAMCHFFDKSVLFLSFKRATYALNKSIDSRHYKRLRRKILVAFHSLPRFTLNHAVKSIILNLNVKLLQNDSETGAIFS